MKRLIQGLISITNKTRSCVEKKFKLLRIKLDKLGDIK